MHVEHDRHLVAGLDVAEVVLGHVGADPEVVDGDQRHRRRAGLRELPDVGAQVGHQAAGGRDHLGALQVQLGLLDRRAGAEQLRVAFAAVARGLLGAAQVGLGRLHLADGLDAVGLRVLDAAQRRSRRDLPRRSAPAASRPAGRRPGWPWPPAARPWPPPPPTFERIDRAPHRLVVRAAALQRDAVLASDRCRTGAVRAAPRRCS